MKACVFNQYFKTVSPSQQTYSCSCDGTILQWDSASLKVKRQFYLSCERLSSIQIHDGTLWCCECFSLYTHNSCSANLFHTHTQIINDSSIYCSSLKSYCCSLYFIACVCVCPCACVCRLWWQHCRIEKEWDTTKTDVTSWWPAEYTQQLQQLYRHPRGDSEYPA